MRRDLALRLLTLLIAGILANAVVPTARAEGPPFKLVRADEVYEDAGRAPVYKHLAPVADSPLYVSFGGEVRERIDTSTAARFGFGAGSDTYVLQRLLAFVDVHDGIWRTFVELGHHDAFSKATMSPVDANGTDVQVAFVEVTLGTDPAFTIRAGRQEVLLNSAQRFVAVREGPNVRQSFDGVRATGRFERAEVNLLALRPVVPQPGAFDDRVDPAQRFWGTNVSMPTSVGLFDLYWLELDRSNALWGGVRGQERRRSVGSHFRFQHGAWDVDGDVVWQSGTFAGRDIAASAGGIEAGYAPGTAWRPRFSLRLDTGSGGAFERSGALHAFNPLFPKAGYFDESANGSWVNLMALRPAVTLTPMARLSLQASAFFRWRRDVEDAVYVHPVSPVTQTLDNRSRYVGASYAVDGTFEVNAYLRFIAELVRQQAGPAIENAGGHGFTFAMLTTQVRF